MEYEICQDQCGSEGYCDPNTLALFCDDCGKPAMGIAMTRLSKSLKRQDERDQLRRFAIMASATWAAVVNGERP